MAILAGFAVPHPPLIIPDVGRGREQQIQKTIDSYKEVAREIAKLNPETIVISSPHTACYRDYFYISSKPTLKGSFAQFGAPEVKFSEMVDQELSDEISRLCENNNFPAGQIDQTIDLDHGTMVPLYFIRKELHNCKIVVLGLSGLSLENHYEFGKIISEAINNLNKKVIYVGSGDLSHKLQEDGPYGYAKEGAIYEEKIVDTMSNANLSELVNYDNKLLEKAAECGHPSFTIMAGALNQVSVKPMFFSHEDVTGVGYGVWSYYPFDEYVDLAKKSIDSYVINNQKLAVPDNLSAELTNNQAGVFVSIHKKGKLRGCIGTIFPVYENIANEIIENAVSASTKDPRFSAITEDELAELDINVDVLTTPEDIDSEEELDPKIYGVIVERHSRRGVLLPDLEGIDTVNDQISIAKEKAGIAQDEDVLLQRFRVVRHK